MGKSREEKCAAGAFRSKTETHDAPTSPCTVLPSPSGCTPTQSTSIANVQASPAAPVIINLTLPAGSASVLRIQPTISQATTPGDHSVLNVTAHPNTPLNLDLPGISISVFQAPEREEIPTRWAPAPTAVDAMSECSTNADDPVTKTPRPAAKPISSQSPPGATNEHAPGTAPSPPKVLAAEPKESVANFYWRYLRPRTPPTHPAGEPAHLYTKPASKENYHRSRRLSFPWESPADTVGRFVQWFAIGQMDEFDLDEDGAEVAVMWRAGDILKEKGYSLREVERFTEDEWEGLGISKRLGVKMRDDVDDFVECRWAERGTGQWPRSPFAPGIGSLKPFSSRGM